MDKLKIHLAPMQGYTEAAYRNAFQSIFGGVDYCYTPFVRLERGDVRKKDLRDINPQNNTTNCLIPQLIAANAQEAEAILAVIAGYDYKAVDINLGCSFPAMAKRKKGSGILPYPELVEQLLAITHQHPEISFSVKMRLGYQDPAECLALTQILNDTPLTQIAVHARIGKQQYKGDCNREAFADFAAHCKHPLIYNGDINTIEEIRKLQTNFPTLQGVMIGRGLLARPWMAHEYKNDTLYQESDKIRLLKDFHNVLFHHFEEKLEGGEQQLLIKMKTFWEYFYPDGDRKLLKKIHKSQKISAYTEAVSQLLR